MILLKEFVQAKAELKSFAVNEIEGLERERERVREREKRRERARRSAYR